MNQSEADTLLGEMMTEWTTIEPATAFADGIRWLMTADNERAASASQLRQLRFGGGPRMTTDDRHMARVAATEQNVDVAYFTFGKQTANKPTSITVIFRFAGKVRTADCSLWMHDDGRLHLVTQDSMSLLIALKCGRLELVGRCPADQLDVGRKRAMALLAHTDVSRRGRLRDQHFFEDCSILAPMRAGLTSEMIAAIDDQ